MLNNTHSSSHNLGTFGWNFSFIGDIKLTTDSDGNVYIFNLGIELLFSQQSSSQELNSSTYSLSSQQLLQPYSSYQGIFKRQADGSYEGNSGTLTWNVDHYELEEANGSKIVFRSDGQLDYVEYSNGYRLSARYTNNLLTELSDSNGDSFTIGYNSDGRIETVTNGAGQVNTYSYDATGQYLLSVEDANGTTSFSYDNPFDPTVVSTRFSHKKGDRYLPKSIPHLCLTLVLSPCGKTTVCGLSSSQHHNQLNFKKSNLLGINIK